MADVRTLPDPGFADDDGAADPEVAAALAAYGEGGSRLAALQVLQHARLLVPVMAVLGEVEHDADGLARDKTSDMATVLVAGPGGRTGLPAFTSAETLARWDPTARPVPVAASLAARAAVQEGAAALVVDVAGPVPFPVEGGSLTGLADGLVLTRLVTDQGERFGWIGVEPGP